MAGGLGKTFNSHSVTGRANVGKATYAVLAAGYVLYRLTRRSKPPPPQPADEEFSAIKEPECGCGCGRKMGEAGEANSSAAGAHEYGNDYEEHVFGNGNGHKHTETHDAHFMPPNVYDASTKKPEDIDSAYITYKTIQILLNNQLQPDEVLHLQKQQELAKRAFERSQKVRGTYLGGAGGTDNAKVVTEVKAHARKGLLDLLREHFTQVDTVSDDMENAEVSTVADKHDNGYEKDVSDVEFYFRFLH